MSLKASDHFLAIWRRALNQPSLDTLSPELISKWAAERGLTGAVTEERDVGRFRKTNSIVLNLGADKGCFPKIPSHGDPNWESRRKAAEHAASLWHKMEWFSPFWVPRDQVNKLLAGAEYCSKEQAITLFDYHTSTIYTLSYQAVCIDQIMTQARCLRNFCPIAREADLAFYSGYRASCISALIPAIEGGLTQIVSQAKSDEPINQKVQRVVDRAIQTAARQHFEQMWVPQEYMTKEYLLGQNDIIFAFETYRRWLSDSFFRKTGEYDGATWLNRHLFAHGQGSNWQQSANFCRLIVALATLGMIESWHDETFDVDIFFPEMTDGSKLLWQQALLRGEIQLHVGLTEQATYQAHGRLVPEMPTDNGVLLRKAILSEDCINDLVRPLREAGWRVDVGEPDERALFVTVEASSDEETFSVALLYSCATDNTIYRKLEESCEAILYRGAPYHQNQYAYGIKVHVGPVTGWQPRHSPARARRQTY